MCIYNKDKKYSKEDLYYEYFKSIPKLAFVPGKSIKELNKYNLEDKDNYEPKYEIELRSSEEFNEDYQDYCKEVKVDTNKECDCYDVTVEKTKIGKSIEIRVVRCLTCLVPCKISVEDKLVKILKKEEKLKLREKVVNTIDEMIKGLRSEGKTINSFIDINGCDCETKEDEEVGVSVNAGCILINKNNEYEYSKDLKNFKIYYLIELLKQKTLNNDNVCINCIGYVDGVDRVCSKCKITKYSNKEIYKNLLLDVRGELSGKLFMYGVYLDYIRNIEYVEENHYGNADSVGIKIRKKEIKTVDLNIGFTDIDGWVNPKIPGYKLR